MKSFSATLLIFLIVTLTLGLTGCGPFLPSQAEETESGSEDQPQPTMTANPGATPSPAPSPTENPMPEPTPTENPLFSEIAALRGVNLGNALDAPAPGAWGVTLTRELVLAVRQAGFNAVRLPVRFSAHTGPGPEYGIDPEFLATVDQVIGWGLDVGLTVILDLHHFDAIHQDPAAARDPFLAIWDQLALHYQGQPENLYFELLNEPTGALDPATWNDLLQEALTLIRRSNPERVIVVSTANVATIDALDQLRLPEDEHLAVTFHYYEPFELTHQGAGWVPGSGAWLGTTWAGTAEEKRAITAAFDKAAAWSAAQGIPLILGEFGTIENADLDSRARWTAFVAQTAEANRMGWIYWELCTNFGIYDCQAGVWNQALLPALLD
jgi:endoglucanase